MSVTDLRGDEVVSSAVLKDGQTVQCDLVVTGIGVQPVIEVVTNSGLDLGDGIFVNEYLQTSHPDVFAAGDVANYQESKRRRVEHGTTPYPRDSTVPGHSWETELRLGMSRISFPTFLISHISIGAIRQVRTRLFIVEMWRATALACGGCISSG